MIQIQAPDGSIVEFPPDTPDDTIKSVMAKSFPAPQAAPQAPVAPQQEDQRWGWQKSLDNAGLQTMKDFSTGVMKGNIPFADEITAGAMTPFGMAKRAFTGQDANKPLMQRASDAYSDALAFNRQTDAEANQRSPIANTLGQVAGAVNTAGTLANGGVTLLKSANPTVGGMAARGAAEGAIYGGVYGAGEGEGFQDRVKKAGWGLLTGGVTGALTGALTGKLAQRAAEKTVPTADAIKAQAQAAYRSAENAGVVFRPDKYSAAVDDMFSNAANKGFDPALTPNTAAAFKRIEELKGNVPLTLQTIEQRRKILNIAAKKAAASPDGKADAALANSMIRRLDNFVEDNANVLVSGGNPDAATAALKEARSLWRKSAKSEQITELLSNAKLRAQNYSQSGYDNALKTEFMPLARSKSKLRGFTEEEQAAIRKVVDGSLTEKALRGVGKFAIRGPISGGVNLMAGGVTANPVVPFVTAGIAEAAKQGASAMRSSNANLVDLLIRSGGQLPQAKALSPAQRMIIDSLLASQPQLMNRQQVPTGR